MRLTIIFITACCISLFSYASPCDKCKKEPGKCVCLKTVSDLRAQRGDRNHHAGYGESPSLNTTQDSQKVIAGELVVVPDIYGEGRNSMTVTSDSTHYEVRPSSSYGCCVNRKNKPETPAFSGTGRSLQATSSQPSTGSECCQASDILGIVAGLSNLTINETSQEYISTLAPLNTAFISSFVIHSQIPDAEQTYESALNATLISVGYQLNHVKIADPVNICQHIRRMLADGNIIYLNAGHDHYIFVPDQNSRFFTVSHFVQSPSNLDYQPTIRRDTSQNLARIKLTKNDALRLYILKKTSDANSNDQSI